MKGGKAVWSYPNPWPGLHASHHAARPTFPGQVIGVTRLMGGFVNPKGSDVGPPWAVNANMGNFYLFTRDGLFVATVFEDVRKGTLWKMPVARRGMPLKGISLHDENFWPSISQTPDGQVYIVDGANCSLVRLDGLETLRRIPRRGRGGEVDELRRAVRNDSAGEHHAAASRDDDRLRRWQAHFNQVAPRDGHRRAVISKYQCVIA
jgi:hypothetical protein